MDVTPLTDTFGARIAGVDLSQPLEDDCFAAIRALWMEHRIVVFPDQTLDDDSLVAFAGRFGRLFVHAQTSLLSKKRKEVMELSNLPEAARKTVHDLDWHTDQSYTPQPVFGTMLFGVVAPREGGETLIADLAGAYASLPDALRRRVEGVSAVYSAEPRPKVRETPLNESEKQRIPDCTHPIVRTHPYLDRKSLYISPLHMKTIGNLLEEDSIKLIAELTAHATQPAHVYRHRWTEGDLIMWDNTSVMHRRTPFPPEVPRYLKRSGFYLPDDRATPF